MPHVAELQQTKELKRSSFKIPPTILLEEEIETPAVETLAFSASLFYDS